MNDMSSPLVGIIMGSDSDLDIMSDAAKLLDEFGIAHEVRVVSAHRTPEEMASYAKESRDRGMTASETTLPVIAVPIKREGGGHEAFWSNIKMPPGVPLATMPENGARNAALLAVRILALADQQLYEAYSTYVHKQHDDVVAIDKQLQDDGWQTILKQ